MVAALAGSALVVLVMAMLDDVRVTSKADQASIAFGLPVAWIHQDQTSLDPPFPFDAGLESPWEHPADVSWTTFGGDVGLVLLVALTLWAAIALTPRLRSWRRR